ncbi:hypothetical protein L493_2901 [Bordetella bronchiseptica 99-R-0433]|nr:hypothetical protein L493_2901 [Bordetella bronchiseptica 99-R-0433]
MEPDARKYSSVDEGNKLTTERILKIHSQFSCSPTRNFV